MTGSSLTGGAATLPQPHCRNQAVATAEAASPGALEWHGQAVAMATRLRLHGNCGVGLTWPVAGPLLLRGRGAGLSRLCTAEMHWQRRK